MPDQIAPDQNPEVWQPDRAGEAPAWPVPPILTALWRGVRGLCPACGQTHAFAGYLKVVPQCTSCGAPLGQVRADDAPPYFTVFIVGHILVGILYEVETTYKLSMAALAAIFLPAALILTLGLLRPIKGATLGLMLSYGMVKKDDT